MNKVIYFFAIFTIQHLTLNIQNSFAQAANDNIGSGNCLSFDGANDFVNVPASSSLNFSSSDPFTVSCWVKTSTSLVNLYLINKQRNVANEFFFTMAIGQEGGGSVNNGQFYFKVGAQNIANVYAYSGFVANPNEWYHLTGVSDGSKISLYVNGELKSSTNIGFSGNQSQANLSFARLYNNSRFWSGQMDEVRIWDKVLTESEIKNDMCRQLVGNEANLVGYWNMNEGTGNTVSDLTSNANHGTRL